MPCNTNGELDHFILIVNGIPTFTSDDQYHPSFQENFTVQSNDPIENIVYQYSLNNILASYQYSITIVPVLVNGVEGESEEVTFTSPDGCKLCYLTYILYV